MSNFDDSTSLHPSTSVIHNKKATKISALDRAFLAAQVAADNRAQNIVILDLRNLTQNFDYFVIASGTSRRQLHAVSEEIDSALENRLGDKRLSISGYQESRWIVLDYGDIIIHLFEPETREFYALEELWAKGGIVPFEPEK
ncbi:MAG: ribosome silencing factor [Planctomycetaceae bacterium]|nr:ribosome silencing factor [Planctomycetaceae bacterium]